MGRADQSAGFVCGNMGEGVGGKRNRGGGRRWGRERVVLKMSGVRVMYVVILRFEGARNIFVGLVPPCDMAKDPLRRARTVQEALPTNLCFFRRVFVLSSRLPVRLPVCLAISVWCRLYWRSPGSRDQPKTQAQRQRMHPHGQNQCMQHGSSTCTQ